MERTYISEVTPGSRVKIQGFVEIVLLEKDNGIIGILNSY